MTISNAERIRSYRKRRRELGEPDITRKNKNQINREWKRTTTKTSRHFVGCDGEGCGVDDKGRQLYMLFRMGDRELFTGAPLRTVELLDFICNHSSDGILVGFAFGYDVTMILRDLSEQQQRRLFAPKDFSVGHSHYVWYKDFDIDYLPRQYFRVRRVRIVRQPDGSEKRIGIKGSQRTIYETFGFFQKSFLKTIKDFSVGDKAQLERIETNKNARADFAEMTQEVRDYCALECDFLGQLMERLREYCHAAGIVPRTWNGAGKLASALHKMHATIRHSELPACLPPDVDHMANMAYYGGRFEITRTGAINQTIYEYDICSAYPDAMRKLPCLCHGRWEQASAKQLAKHDGLYLAAVKFKCSPNADNGSAQLGALPVRSKEGHLYWPLQGAGIYWSPEIESARELGFKIQLKAGWTYHKQCNCDMFGWVEQLYNYRKSIGSQGAGYPIKLGINSLYGKLAQRKGNGVYNNMVWAGLITSYTRTKLNAAIRKNPSRIVMVATDAIYSLDPLDLDFGSSLGQWDEAKFDGLFIVQPGLYWCPAKRKRKSRGLSGSFFERGGLTERFEADWHFYQSQNQAGLSNDFPAVTVPVPGFIGLKLALARNKPDLAGTWVNETRAISFDYRNKRQGHIWHDGHIITGIKSGRPDLISLPHRDFLAAGGQEPWENARLALEEQPDYIDFSPPFED